MRRHSFARAVTLGLIGSAMLAGGMARAAAYQATVVATGLNNPRGLAFGPDGALYVAESGVNTGGIGPSIVSGDGSTVRFDPSGSITRIFGGTQSRIVVGLPALVEETSGGGATGPQDIAFGADGTGYVVIGLGTNPGVRTGALASVFGATNLGRVFTFTAGGTVTSFADVSAFEAANNPDLGGVDSNPFRLAPTAAGGLLVTDAGANDLLDVSSTGLVSLVAVVPAVSASIQSVPTGVTTDADGNIYVAQLTGAPFPTGQASIYRILKGTTTPELFQTGFSTIGDIAFGADGSLFVLELDSNGLVAPGGTGTVIRLAADGTRETVYEGLVAPTGLAVGADDALYVTNFSPVARIGQVLRIAAIPEPATWATLILGFGLVGAALRRRPAGAQLRAA